MTAFRLLRIAAIAIGFWFVFNTSQRITAERNAGAGIPGIEWAIGGLALVFLAGAFVSERAIGPEGNPRKDLLWGLGAGGVAIWALRVSGALG